MLILETELSLIRKKGLIKFAMVKDQSQGHTWFDACLIFGLRLSKRRQEEKFEVNKNATHQQTSGHFC